MVRREEAAEAAGHLPQAFRHRTAARLLRRPCRLPAGNGAQEEDVGRRAGGLAQAARLLSAGDPHLPHHGQPLLPQTQGRGLLRRGQQHGGGLDPYLCLLAERHRSAFRVPQEVRPEQQRRPEP